MVVIVWESYKVFLIEAMRIHQNSIETSRKYEKMGGPRNIPHRPALATP